MAEDEAISIKEATKRLNITIYTARYFCDHGYISHVRRDHNYQRILTPAQFQLLAMLVGMKQSGFSKSEIKRYAKLHRQGPATAEARLAILTTKKHQLQNEIKNRQTAIDFIERQEEIYHQNHLEEN